MRTNAALLWAALLAGAPARADVREADAAFKAGGFAAADQLYRAAAASGDVSAQSALARMSYDGLGVRKDWVEAAKWARAAADQGSARDQALLGMLVDYGMGGVPIDKAAAKALYGKAFAAASARSGEAEGAFVLSGLYRLGHGVAADGAKALELLRAAAERGDAEAQEALGGMLMTGLDAPKDLDQAAKWLGKASAAGQPLARVQLATLQIDAQGGLNAPEEGFKTYRALAEAGLGEAMAQLGTRYYYGSKTPHDFPAALQWLKRGAELEDMNAQNVLATMYREGVGVPRDYAEALRWSRRAAAMGSRNARAEIGVMYLKGLGTAKDYDEAFKWLSKAAAVGHPEALAALASMYIDGKGAAQDYAQAWKLLRQATDQNGRQAQNLTGLAYERGLGVGKDVVQAAKWYRLAADQRDPDGENNVGRCYSNGWGVAKDDAEALKWYRKSAEHGSPYGQDDLGWAYLNGRGAKPDYVSALSWFRKSAAQGDAAAMTNLGAMYENGQGVPQDYVEADKFYILAIAKSHAAARARQKKLVALMTREQVAEAQKRAADVPAAASATAGAAAEPNTTQSSDVDAPAFKLAPRPDDFALVVGIEKYGSLPEARFAERDAEAVRKNLADMGVPERNIVFLVGAAATRSRLAAYLEEWLPKNVKPDSTVFFYYSGHGAPDAQSRQAYLLPSDGDPAFLKSTAYPLKQVYAELGALKAKTVVAALDSCFSGAGGRSVLPRGARPLVTHVDTETGAGKLVLFTASGGDQISGGSEEQAHGTFTYYFLKGLAGEAKDASGAVTTGGLYRYLKPLVQDEARRQNREQTPGLAGDQGLVLDSFRP